MPTSKHQQRVSELNEEIKRLYDFAQSLRRKLFLHVATEEDLQRDIEKWEKHQKASTSLDDSRTLEELTSRLDNLFAENIRLQELLNQCELDYSLRTAEMEDILNEEWTSCESSEKDVAYSEPFVATPPVSEGDGAAKNELVPIDKGENDEERRMSSSDNNRTNTDLADSIIALYGSDIKEAARAVGMKRSSLEGIRDGSKPCSDRMRKMLIGALEVAQTPDCQKREELTKQYNAILEDLSEKEAKNPQKKSLIDRSTVAVRETRDEIPNLSEEMINGMYWRCVKNRTKTFSEAHIHALSAKPYSYGIPRVVRSIVFDRFQRSQLSDIEGFKLVQDKMLDKFWMDGLLMEACYDNHKNGTDADFAYIPKETLKRYLGLYSTKSIPEPLYFLSDEDNQHIHINFRPHGEKAPRVRLSSRRSNIEEPKPFSAIRVERHQCLFFSSNYNGEEPCDKSDVYPILTRPNGVAFIENKIPFVFPVMKVQKKADGSPAEEVPFPALLSKIEVFFGMAPDARDLIKFIRRKLLPNTSQGQMLYGNEDDDVDEEEETTEDDTTDPKIGIIYIRNPSSFNLKRERRYVYSSMECLEPYYLSKTNNRIFVVDKSRIEYFPGGIEPAEVRRIMKSDMEVGDDEHLDQISNGVTRPNTTGGDKNLEKTNDMRANSLTDANSAIVKAASPLTPTSDDGIHQDEDEKIGIIFIKMGKNTDQGYSAAAPKGMTTRDVFCSKQFGCKPYYLTHTGNKIFVVDKSRIILNNPAPEKRKRKMFFF